MIMIAYYHLLYLSALRMKFDLLDAEAILSQLLQLHRAVCCRKSPSNMFTTSNLIYFLCAFLALGVEGSQTDIPCISDDDCRLNNEVSGECVDDRCIYRVREPRLMTMVTRLGGQCRFHDECNIAEAECTENQCTCRNSTVESKDRRRCLKVAESIGDDCEEAGQCAFANATCMQSKCLCRRGFGVESGVSEGTECRELRGVGSRCTSDVECEMEGTRCDANKTCECIDGHSAFEGACFEDSFTLMSPCNITFQCKRNLGEHAECRKGLCMCETQFNYDKLSNVCEPQIRSIEHSNSGIQQLPIGLLFFVCPLSMLLKL